RHRGRGGGRPGWRRGPPLPAGWRLHRGRHSTSAMDTGATVNAAPMRVGSRRFEQAQPEPVARVVPAAHDLQAGVGHQRVERRVGVFVAVLHLDRLTGLEMEATATGDYVLRTLTDQERLDAAPFA